MRGTTVDSHGEEDDSSEPELHGSTLSVTTWKVTKSGERSIAYLLAPASTLAWIGHLTALNLTSIHTLASGSPKLIARHSEPCPIE